MNQCLPLQAVDRLDLPSSPGDAPVRDEDELQDVGASANAKAFPLSMASDGEQVRITQLLGGKGLAMRLTELGLNQGTEISVVQRQGGGLVVARGGTRIALGGGMAMKILVNGAGR